MGRPKKPPKDQPAEKPAGTPEQANVESKKDICIGISQTLLWRLDATKDALRRSRTSVVCEALEAWLRVHESGSSGVASPEKHATQQRRRRKNKQKLKAERNEAGQSDRAAWVSAYIRDRRKNHTQRMAANADQPSLPNASLGDRSDIDDGANIFEAQNIDPPTEPISNLVSDAVVKRQVEDISTTSQPFVESQQ